MDELVVNESLPSFFISRDLVDEYCRTKEVDVYSLLQTSVNNGLSDFLNFLSQKGIALSILEDDPKTILHGSGNVISQFEPRISEGGPNANQHEPLVYASDDPDYAIFLAIIRLNGEGSMASVGYTRGGDTECSVNLAFVNGESKLSDGYVYLLNRQTFNEDALHNFSSPKSQIPILAIPVSPSDLHTIIQIKN